MKEIIDYILQFLLRDKQLIQYVGYTTDVNQWKNYKIIIVPSEFFKNDVYGTGKSMPSLPLKELEGIPILFGEPKIEEKKGIIICHADLIASTYFLITRYQEYIYPNQYRDEHGRFKGKESIPYKAKFIDRPIIEEYGEFLNKLLQKADIQTPIIANTLNKIYLTHDVDTLTNYRRLRGAIGAICRCIITHKDKLSNIIKSQTDIEKDPVYTFPWIYKQDNKIQGAIPIYFIKAAKPIKGYDYPGYNLIGRDFQRFIKKTTEANNKTIYGLHASYRSGSKPEITIEERRRLQYAIPQQEITTARHHYLRTLQPEDMESLLEARITDDFTMGYADIAGFRLGTCRPVKFINPKTKHITQLTMHPLTIMDCTLDREQYMNLNYKEAFAYTTKLIKYTKRYNGDLCLLWHNTTFCADNYHKKLYAQIINTLCQ